MKRLIEAFATFIENFDSGDVVAITFLIVFAYIVTH